jgi:hypothetical protein
MIAQPKRPADAGMVGVNRGYRNDAGPPGAFGAKRRRATADAQGGAAADEARKIRAALEQIDEYGEIRGFAGRPHEKLALVTFATGRGLIAWHKARGRHELTAAGRRWLAAHGGVARVCRSKFPSRMMAATLCVIVLAGAWFSANASYQIFSPPSRTTPAFFALSRALPHQNAKVDPTAAGDAKSPGEQHPLALIQSEAPIFAATRPAVAADAPKLAAMEPSRPPSHAMKRTARPARKAVRVVRPWNDDRGSAMAFSDPFRPSRGW